MTRLHILNGQQTIKIIYSKTKFLCQHINVHEKRHNTITKFHNSNFQNRFIPIQLFGMGFLR